MDCHRYKTYIIVQFDFSIKLKSMKSILFILFFSCSNQPNKDVKNKLTHDLEKQECKKFVFPIDVKRLTK